MPLGSDSLIGLKRGFHFVVSSAFGQISRVQEANNYSKKAKTIQKERKKEKQHNNDMLRPLQFRPAPLDVFLLLGLLGLLATGKPRAN